LRDDQRRNHRPKTLIGAFGALAFRSSWFKQQTSPNVCCGSKPEVAPLKRQVRSTLRRADIVRLLPHVGFVPKPEVFNGLGHVPLAQWMSAVRSRHRLLPPGRAMRAYQTSGHLPVAVAHAFVLTRPTSGVDTSAQAICGLILTSRGYHCFRR